MSSKTKGWLLAGAALLLCLFVSVWWFLRPAPSNPLVSLLPDHDALIAYADFALVRRTGLLSRIAGQQIEEDEEYKRFVAATGFNYREDLDAAAVSSSATANFAVARGRFDRARIERYAVSQGGRCEGGACRLPASHEQWTTAIRFLQPDLIALASSADAAAIQSVGAKPGDRALPVPQSIAWVYMPEAWNEQTAGRTPVMRGFNAALDGAHYTVISLEAQPRPKLAMTAQARNADAARRILERWQAIVQGKAGLPPLPPFVQRGQFRTDGAVVRGEWVIDFGS